MLLFLGLGKTELLMVGRYEAATKRTLSSPSLLMVSLLQTRCHSRARERHLDSDLMCRTMPVRDFCCTNFNIYESLIVRNIFFLSAAFVFFLFPQDILFFAAATGGYTLLFLRHILLAGQSCRFSTHRSLLYMHNNYVWFSSSPPARSSARMSGNEAARTAGTGGQSGSRSPLEEGGRRRLTRQCMRRSTKERSVGKNEEGTHLCLPQIELFFYIVWEV